MPKSKYWNNVKIGKKEFCLQFNLKENPIYYIHVEVQTSTSAAATKKEPQ
jgi:hypothetical protein